MVKYDWSFIIYSLNLAHCFVPSVYFSVIEKVKFGLKCLWKTKK